MGDAIILSILERIGVMAERLSWWAFGRRSEIELRLLYRRASRAPGPRTFVVRDGLFGRARPQLVSSTPVSELVAAIAQPAPRAAAPARRRAVAG